MFLVNRARPVRKSDNLTAICEPIGYANGSQPVVRVPLGVRENNIGSGGKHQKKTS
jgi:hypothetical protein